MVETAQYLKQKDLDKAIVLTGAFRPYLMHESDATFNLGCAIAFANTLKTGKYIAMNGKVFGADNVKKNKEKSVFETLN